MSFAVSLKTYFLSINQPGKYLKHVNFDSQYKIDTQIKGSCFLTLMEFEKKCDL